MHQKADGKVPPAGETEGNIRDIRELLSFRLTLLADSAERLGQMHTVREARLRINEWRVLALACVMRPARFSDIARTLSMDKGQLSRIVKLLGGRGLLESKPDTHDQRAISLHLTEEGRKIHDSLYDRFENLNARIMTSLDDGDRSELMRLLDIVSRSIQRAEARGI